VEGAERVLEMEPPPRDPGEIVREISLADRRRAVVGRLMWFAGISAISAGVGLRAGYDCALIVAGSLVWGEYFVGGIVELLVSRKGAK
jgi:hydrogenase maturation factor HypE